MIRKRSKVMRLWGVDFNIVTNGLDKDQIVSFVDELLTEQEEHRTYLGKLAEQTVIEAHKLAASIKSEAEAEAERQKDKIIEEAEAKARLIVEDATGIIARLVTEKSESILEAARGKAAAIEAEAKWRAKQIITRARQRIESELEGVANGFYQRLLPTLESLSEQVRNHEAEFDIETLSTVASPNLASGSDDSRPNSE